MLPAALRAVRAVDEVIDVESQLGYAIDDIRLPRVPVAGLLTVNVRIGGSGDSSHPTAGPSSL
jgi:hypothetical protein